MSQENKYRVTLLDTDGYEISESQADSLKEAKATMAYMLTDEYARGAETTHETMGTQKAEVRNTKGECILDGFLDPGGAKHAGKSLIAQLLPPDKKRTRYDDSQRD